jgi:hypothetical protein
MITKVHQSSELETTRVHLESFFEISVKLQISENFQPFQNIVNACRFVLYWPFAAITEIERFTKSKATYRATTPRKIA